MPFTDDLGDDPTGRTFNIVPLTSDPALRQFRMTNPEGVEQNIDAVSLNLLKRMSGNWQMNASATWLPGTGRITEPGGPGLVGIQQRGGLQFRDFGKNPNDFVNGDGRCAWT